MSQLPDSSDDTRDKGLPRIVVFSDDWGRHASSCQHLVNQLLPRFRVDWVETVGTRTPKFSLADMRRGVTKIKDYFRAEPDRGVKRVLHPNLKIYSPHMIPSFASVRRRRWNARLLARGLADILDPTNPPEAVIATAPIVADLAQLTPYLHWIYYCVDALDEWPGLDGATLCQMEVDWLPTVNRVIVVSEALRKRMQARGIEPTMLTHGVDLERWRIDREGHVGRVPPKTLFWGHADERLDTPTVLALAENTDLTFVGPKGPIDPVLANHPRIHWQGAVNFDDLPGFAAQADVLVMPYGDSAATRNMQPLKLKEYLATGLPTVVAPLPANLYWSEAMDVADTPEQFVASVLERARTGLPPSQAKARKALENEGWDQKAMIFESVIHDR